jgi:hypothetical protein
MHLEDYGYWVVVKDQGVGFSFAHCSEVTYRIQINDFMRDSWGKIETFPNHDYQIRFLKNGIPLHTFILHAKQRSSEWDSARDQIRVVYLKDLHKLPQRNPYDRY